MIAVLHAILFASIMCVVMYFFKEKYVRSRYFDRFMGAQWTEIKENLAETIQNYDSPVTMSPSPSENNTNSSCPAGQNWISGTNHKYGYCSKSTLNEILSDVSPLSSSPSPSLDTHSSCPSGQNWITGSNKKYGYCSDSSVNDVLTRTHEESSETDPKPSSPVNTNLPTSSYTGQSTGQSMEHNSCPTGQTWITGSNKKYGYCSASSTTEILSKMTPSSSSMFTISPTHMN